MSWRPSFIGSVSFDSLFLPPLLRASLLSSRTSNCADASSLCPLPRLQNEYDKCYDDWEKSCLKSKTNPRGIPLQHLFTSQFFGRGAASPFAQWALVPGASNPSSAWRSEVWKKVDCWDETGETGRRRVDLAFLHLELGSLTCLSIFFLDSRRGYSTTEQHLHRLLRRG